MYAISERMNCRFVCAGVRYWVVSVVFKPQIADPVREPSSRTSSTLSEAHARDRRFLRSKTFGALRSAVVYAGKHACDLRLMRMSLPDLRKYSPSLCSLVSGRVVYGWVGEIVVFYGISGSEKGYVLRIPLSATVPQNCTCHGTTTRNR